MREDTLHESLRLPGQKPEAIVIGASAGGIEALEYLLTELPAHFHLPIVVVMHLHPEQDGSFLHYLGKFCPLPVREAEDKEAVLPGCVYFAPPGYHLLVERGRTFALSVDEKLHYARPAIDMLFASAAEAYTSGLVGMILTGANGDGAAGLKRIKELGGATLVQDPAEALHDHMPRAAIAASTPDAILDLEALRGFLQSLAAQAQEDR